MHDFKNPFFVSAAGNLLDFCFATDDYKGFTSSLLVLFVQLLIFFCLYKTGFLGFYGSLISLLEMYLYLAWFS